MVPKILEKLAADNPQSSDSKLGLVLSVCGLHAGRNFLEPNNSSILYYPAMSSLRKDAKTEEKLRERSATALLCGSILRAFAWGWTIIPAGVGLGGQSRSAKGLLRRFYAFLLNGVLGAIDSLQIQLGAFKFGNPWDMLNL